MHNSSKKMQELLDLVQNLKNTEVRQLIEKRINEFSKIRNSSRKKIFEELCFCIMTANCSAEKCIEIQELIGDKFLDLPEEKLAKTLKEYGYRFPNIRAEYIIKAREYQDKLYAKINNEINPLELRKWIVENIKGIGYKEASHFLRNIGFTKYAIIDFHILDLLTKYSLIEKPNNLSKKTYLEIEKILNKLGKRLELNLAELDLYLWYLETGKVLK
jgi:N-glycosylase/DNA lyase